jgi:hypothetical protein
VNKRGWAVHVAYMEKKIIAEKPEGKKTIGTLRHRWEDRIGYKRFQWLFSLA